jgi:hypothetical protein
MKIKLIAILMVLIAGGIFSCDDDETVEDPVYEFVSFSGDELVDLGEAAYSEQGYPLVIQLWAFDPSTTDVSVSFDVTPTNAVRDVDFTLTPADNVTIQAGSLTSDTIWIKSINNEVPNDQERTFDVTISSVSDPDLKIGLGITEPKKGKVTFKIVDDECSGDPRCVFNAALTNNVTASDIAENGPQPATGVVDKLNNTITLTGDLIAYDPFSAATLNVTLTPDSEGSPTGTATFGEQETGADSDGYEYKFIEIGTGSYNADLGIIKIEYDIYYMDGDWIYWYSVKNEFTP